LNQTSVKVISKMTTRTQAAAKAQGRRKKREKASRPRSAQRLGEKPYHVYSIVALVALVFACYANSLGNGFVFDDHTLAGRFSRAETLTEVFSVLRSYRPVRTFSYTIDYWIWGENPFGFHLTNVLLHAAAVSVFFFLVRRLTGKLMISLIAAAIFATHPIQTDAVSYVSGRRDVLFALFYFAAFLSYLNYSSKRSIKSLLMFAAFWGLSLMSKEMAVSLPAVIFLWNFCELWPGQSGTWLRRAVASARAAFIKDKWLYMLLAAAAIAYVLYMIFAWSASGRVTGEGVEYWGGSFFTNLLMAVRIQAWYLKQLVFPTPIAQYYGTFDISYSLLDWRVLVAIAVVGAVIATSFWLLKKDRLMAFAALTYFAMLAPVSQIIPHHEIAADHFLYLPMAGFALLVALAVKALAAKDPRSRQYAYAGVGILIVVFGALTVMRNRDWKDDLAVWQANYTSVPMSPRAAYNLGGMYLGSDPGKAESLFKQSLANDPEFEFGYLALARLYVSQKRIAEAEDMIARGLALYETDAGSHLIRGARRNLYRSQMMTVQAAAAWEAGEPQKTEEFLWEAVKLYPGNVEPYMSLANFYGAKDRPREVEVLRQAVGANSKSFEIHARLVLRLIEEKHYQHASTYIDNMAALSPTKSDCRKAAPFLSSASSLASREPELREASERLRAIISRCAE
jgi:tetratricopeptide (TPR) repeat protein